MNGGGRALTEAFGALGVYATSVLPAIHRERDRRLARAARIPDPVLRGQALAALREKSANVDATGVFATLAPRHRRGAVIRAGVSLQIAVDYLDSLSESADAGGALDDGLQLHRALVGAATGEPVDDPYGLHPRGEDGGYLGELVAECGGAGAVGRRRPSLRPTSCIRVAAPDRRQAAPIDPRLPRQSQFEAAHLRRRGAVGGSQPAGELDGDRRLFVAWQRKRDRRRPRQRLRLHAGGGAPAFRRAPDWRHAVHDTIEAMFRWGAEEPEYARMGGVEMYAAGKRALDQREVVTEGMEGLLAPGYELKPDTPPIAAEAVGGALYSLLYDNVNKKGPKTLPALVPTLVYVTLAPFLGGEGVYEVAIG